MHIRPRVSHPHPNGALERYHRTFREEGQSGAAPADDPAALALITEWVQTYDTGQLHSVLQYLTP
jgi:transposase InsO family protein